MPTLLELAGLKGVTPQGIDGVSIAPTLLGQLQKERGFLYREFSGYGGQQAVWMGRWKAVRQNMLRKKQDPLQIELYDLNADIAESKDLAAKHPDVVERLRQLMAKQHTPSKEFPFRGID